MSKNDKQEMIGMAESLFRDVQSYRTPEKFEFIFSLCLKFWRLSPFNVLLVEAQCPGAEYVFTARQWERDYGRRIKPDAKPIVYLDFSPIGFLYEVGDTEEIPGTERWKYYDYMKEASRPFYENIPIKAKWINGLIDGMIKCGIVYNDKLEAAASYAGHIDLNECPSSLEIPVYKGYPILYDKIFHAIAINRKISFDDRTLFMTLLHELAHYFLRHLPAPDNWTSYHQRDKLSVNSQEFEAETVVYLICGRLGFKEHSSAEYLSHYLDGNGLIPEFSFDDVSKAVISIEKMIHWSFSVKDGYLYKYDHQFAQRVKQEITNIKRYEKNSLH